MNKGELINSIAEGAGITKAQATAALDATLSSIQNALKSGDKVTLVGFGTFSVTKREERMGRNPKTGVPLKIAAKTSATFKAGSGLNDSLA